LLERILECQSGADFIEDPEIMAYVRQIQAQGDTSMHLFVDSEFPVH
jgi:hypothetical protein